VVSKQRWSQGHLIAKGSLDPIPMCCCTARFLGCSYLQTRLTAARYYTDLGIFWRNLFAGNKAEECFPYKLREFPGIMMILELCRGLSLHFVSTEWNIASSGKRQRDSARDNEIRKARCHHAPDPAIVISDGNSHCFHQGLRQEEECRIWPSVCDDINGSLSRSWELLPAC